MGEEMDNLWKVMSSYDLIVYSIIPFCREVFRVETNDGPKALKICDRDKAKVAFIYGVMQHLWEHGFRKISKPIATKDGDPYAEKDGVIYFLADWLEGNQCDFDNLADLRSACVTLAEFHRYSHGYKPLAEAKGRMMSNKWLSTLSERQDELKFFAEKARQLSTLFSEKYLRYYDYFYGRSEIAYQILADSDYPQLATEAVKQGFFTHRDVAGRNFIMVEQDAYLIDFDYSRYDIRVTDIVRVLERALKGYNWSTDVGSMIIDSYNKENPLLKEEFIVILAFITWPQKFWRLSNRYFKCKKPWEEESYVRKFNSLIKNAKYQDHFVEWFEEKYCCRTGGK